MKSKKNKHFEELCEHKKYIIDSCKKLALYHLNNDDEEFALKLMRRAFIHDISKLSRFEFNALEAFDSFHVSSKRRNYVFSDSEKVFLNEHWKNNKHHPEYWENVEDMTDLDIAEMVCDWHSRSVEFGDDLMAYIQYRQAHRMAFPDDIYQKILEYATILLN